MAWLIGVDEAGYGPNLGPLCIAATAWRVDDRHFLDAKTGQPQQTLPDLYALLGTAVARQSCHDALAIADSKKLYKPGGGLEPLELGVLAAAGVVDPLLGPPFRTGVRGEDAQNLRPLNSGATFDGLLAQLEADPQHLRRNLPWYADCDQRLPVAASLDDLAAAAHRLQTASAAASVSLHALRARLVFPAEFNDLVAKYDTKGAALSHVTLALVRQVVDLLPEGSVHVTCDKHGGRNRYGALLQHHFPENWVKTIVESRAISRYQWKSMNIAFRTGGEAELPAALASMTAKYLRELCMQAFNTFWIGQLPELKPTAGYPVDARRFRADIAAMQRALAIDDHALWRCR